jgi:hypothetical protein
MTLLNWRRALLFDTNKLPSKYRELEYIQNETPVYIDTGVNIAPNLAFETKVQLIHTDNTSQSIWGGRVSTGEGYQLSCVKSTGVLQFMTSKSAAIASTKFDYETHVYKAVDKRLYIDDVLCYDRSLSPDVGSYNYPIYLFATNTSGAVGFSGGSLKMYYFKIWDKTVLVRDFIPCYDKDNSRYGMYDLITKTFYPIVNF